MNTMPPCPDFLLLGDSHAAAIGRAARLDGVSFHGGPLGSGREFFSPFFTVGDGRLALTGEQAAKLLAKFLTDLGIPALEQLKCPLVSTLGLSPHFMATREIWSCYAAPDTDPDTETLHSPIFAEVVEEMLAVPLTFYRHLVGNGVDVIGVAAPQRVPDLSIPSVFTAVQDQMLDRYRAIGMRLIDLRQDTGGSDGWLRTEFCKDNDPLHANEAFGRLVLQEIRGVLVTEN
ncbi:hypothetical protein [Roseibium sp.]|uniref:hypothetical protein n=1 Tax=Roseibium sp. TaxID=1936156 RepID=UPI003BB0A7D8